MSDYFVRKSGNDGNSGLSAAQAKLTLNAVEDIPVVPGDNVYIGAGTYRELLTVDVNGTALLPISYIGDYSGIYTGDAGVVRLTGSNDDITYTRDNVIIGTGKSYRKFISLKTDLSRYQTINPQTNCSNWTIKNCFFGDTFFHGLNLSQPGINFYIDGCFFGQGMSGWGKSINITHSSTLDNRNINITNCIFASSTVNVQRVGGILINNCTFYSGYTGVLIDQALAVGQTIQVYNSIFCGAVYGLRATVLGEIVEDYNTFFGNATARLNVAVGAHSVAYPPLFDSRWFFEAVK